MKPHRTPCIRLFTSHYDREKKYEYDNETYELVGIKRKPVNESEAFITVATRSYCERSGFIFPGNHHIDRNSESYKIYVDADRLAWKDVKDAAAEIAKIEGWQRAKLNDCSLSLRTQAA